MNSRSKKRTDKRKSVKNEIPERFTFHRPLTVTFITGFLIILIGLAIFAAFYYFAILLNPSAFNFLEQQFSIPLSYVSLLYNKLLMAVRDIVFHANAWLFVTQVVFYSLLSIILGTITKGLYEMKGYGRNGTFFYFAIFFVFSGYYANGLDPTGHGYLYFHVNPLMVLIYLFPSYLSFLLPWIIVTSVATSFLIMCYLQRSDLFGRPIIKAIPKSTPKFLKYDTYIIRKKLLSWRNKSIIMDENQNEIGIAITRMTREGEVTLYDSNNNIIGFIVGWNFLDHRGAHIATVKKRLTFRLQWRILDQNGKEMYHIRSNFKGTEYTMTDTKQRVVAKVKTTILRIGRYTLKVKNINPLIPILFLLYDSILSRYPRYIHFRQW